MLIINNLIIKHYRQLHCMLTHIHHINFVVKDLGSASTYFTHLLQQQPTLENLPQRKVNTARYKIGESLLVLVQPIDKTGVVADVLANKGEGVFLLSFATDCIDDTLAQLELSAGEHRKGLDGWDICDLSSIEQFGAILQLTNKH